MKPYRVPIGEARTGDILLFKGSGLLYELLSRIIKLKVPTWDRVCWHMAPVVAPDTILDAQWPRLKPASISGYLKAGKEIRAYRIFETPPDPVLAAQFVRDYTGCRYDWFVYVLTALAVLLRPKVDVPRVINRAFDCWEITFCFADEMGDDITPEYHYPFLTDFLKLAGEC